METKKISHLGFTKRRYRPTKFEASQFSIGRGSVEIFRILKAASSHKTNSVWHPLFSRFVTIVNFPYRLPPYIDFHIDILTAMQIQIKMFFVPFNLSNWTRECQNPFSLLVQKERSLGSFFLNWLLSRSRSIHQSIDSQTSENRDNLKRVKSFSTPQRTTSKLCCCWNFKSIFTADKNYKLLSNLWKHFFLSIFQKKRSLKKSSELGKKWKLVLVFWSSFDSEEEELRRRTKKTKVGRWCLGAAGKALSYFYGRTAENYY